MIVKLSKEDKVKVLVSGDLYSIMKRILLRQAKIRRRQEYFWAVGLEQDLTISFIELLNIGSVNSMIIEPRELFRMSVIKNVPQVILVHNHPSGSAKPSANDGMLTDKLRESGDLLGIKILDHLVITETQFYSFADKRIWPAPKE